MRFGQESSNFRFLTCCCRCLRYSSLHFFEQKTIRPLKVMIWCRTIPNGPQHWSHLLPTVVTDRLPRRICMLICVQFLCPGEAPGECSIQLCQTPPGTAPFAS